MNIIKILENANQAASTGNSKLFGLQIGIVTNVNDPQKLGRVKVQFPSLPTGPEVNWCRVAQPSAGAGRGFYWIPQVEDEVLVAFVYGDANNPVILGSLWNGKDSPMPSAFTSDNTKILIQTTSGHQVMFDDKNGQEKIVIADKSGKRALTFDVKQKKFLIEASEGDVEIKAEKKIRLECEDLEIKTSKTGKIDIGSTFDLNVKDKASFKAGPQLNIKASRVNIN